jgi:hypothetical protein
LNVIAARFQQPEIWVNFLDRFAVAQHFPPHNISKFVSNAGKSFEWSKLLASSSKDKNPSCHFVLDIIAQYFTDSGRDTSHHEWFVALKVSVLDVVNIFS